MSVYSYLKDLRLSADSTNLSLGTERFSRLSDSIFEPLVVHTAEAFASRLRTPPHLLEMLLFIEDKRFPIHLGLDPISILRACIFNFRGGTLQGGSTIPQQLYSMRRGPVRGGSWKRKIVRKSHQCLCGVWYSIRHSKMAILREYLDSVYLGRSYYGIDRAAAGYFSAQRESLSVIQSFLLAERIASPNRVSLVRISNLLCREPIINSIHRRGAGIREIADLYQRIFY